MQNSYLLFQVYMKLSPNFLGSSFPGFRPGKPGNKASNHRVLLVMAKLSDLNVIFTSHHSSLGDKAMKTRLAVYALLLIVAVFYTVPPAHAGTPSQRLMLPQNTEQFTYAPLAQPQCAAVDGQGNVYIADSANYRILKYSPSGALLAKLGSYGAGNGQFYQSRRRGRGRRWERLCSGSVILRYSAAFRSSTPTAPLSPSGAAFGDGDGQFKESLGRGRGRPWGMSMLRTPLTAAFRNSLPTARFITQMGQQRHRRWSVLCALRGGGGRPGERLCGG